MGSTIRKQRVMDAAAAAAAQLPLSTYTVQDPNQGVVPSTMARSFFPPQNNPHMYGQRPVSQMTLESVKITVNITN